MKINEIYSLKNWLGKMSDKATAKENERMAKVVAKDAFDNFATVLRKNGYNLTNTAQMSADIDKLSQFLVKWTVNYMTTGEDDEIKKVILKNASTTFRPPTVLNVSSLKEYFLSTAMVRAQAKSQGGQSIDDPTPPPSPATKASDTIEDPNMQFRFLNQDYPGENVYIVIRKNGYFWTKLPKSITDRMRADPQFAARIRRDKDSKMYPLTRPDLLDRADKLYFKAAKTKNVIEEPIAIV